MEYVISELLKFKLEVIETLDEYIGNVVIRYKRSSVIRVSEKY